MNYVDAQRNFAEIIKTIAKQVDKYYWRLTGDEPNSLCKLLDIPWEELQLVMRSCKIFNGEEDKFSRKKFESLMTECGREATPEWTTYYVNGTMEYHGWKLWRFSSSERCV